MCKLVVGVKKAGKNQTFNELIYAQERGLKSQPDGIGAIVVSKTGLVEVFRDFTVYNNVFAEVYKRLNDSVFVSIHTRIGTSGKKDLTNVHFFEDNGYVFAHNGFVGAYHSPKVQYMGFEGDDYYGGYGYNNYMKPLWQENISEPIINEPEPDKAKVFAQKNYKCVSDVIEDCWNCCVHARLCDKHLDVQFYLLDDSDDFFKALKMHKELILNSGIPDKVTKVTQLAMQEVKKNLVDIRIRQNRPQPDKFEKRKKLSKKEKKLAKKKFEEEHASDFCDSFQFLQNIKKPLTKEIIEAEVKARNFTGMGIMVNKNTLEASMLCYKACKGVTDQKTFGMFFSYDPIMELENESEVETIVCGVPLTGEVKQESFIDLPVLDIVEGVHELKKSIIIN